MEVYSSFFGRVKAKHIATISCIALLTACSGASNSGQSAGVVTVNLVTLVKAPSEMVLEQASDLEFRLQNGTAQSIKLGGADEASHVTIEKSEFMPAMDSNSYEIKPASVSGLACANGTVLKPGQSCSYDYVVTGKKVGQYTGKIMVHTSEGDLSQPVSFAVAMPNDPCFHNAGINISSSAFIPGVKMTIKLSNNGEHDLNRLMLNFPESVQPYIHYDTDSLELGAGQSKEIAVSVDSSPQAMQALKNWVKEGGQYSVEAANLPKKYIYPEIFPVGVSINNGQGVDFTLDASNIKSVKNIEIHNMTGGVIKSIDVLANSYGQYLTIDSSSCLNLPNNQTCKIQIKVKKEAGNVGKDLLSDTLDFTIDSEKLGVAKLSGGVEVEAKRNLLTETAVIEGTSSVLKIQNRGEFDWKPSSEIASYVLTDKNGAPLPASNFEISPSANENCLSGSVIAPGGSCNVNVKLKTAISKELLPLFFKLSDSSGESIAVALNYLDNGISETSLTPLAVTESSDVVLNYLVSDARNSMYTGYQLINSAGNSIANTLQSNVNDACVANVSSLSQSAYCRLSIKVPASSVYKLQSAKILVTTDAGILTRYIMPIPVVSDLSQQSADKLINLTTNEGGNVKVQFASAQNGTPAITIDIKNPSTEQAISDLFAVFPGWIESMIDFSKTVPSPLSEAYVLPNQEINYQLYLKDGVTPETWYQTLTNKSSEIKDNATTGSVLKLTAANIKSGSSFDVKPTIKNSLTPTFNNGALQTSVSIDSVGAHQYTIVNNGQDDYRLSSIVTTHLGDGLVFVPESCQLNGILSAGSSCTFGIEASVVIKASADQNYLGLTFVNNASPTSAAVALKLNVDADVIRTININQNTLNAFIPSANTSPQEQPVTYNVELVNNGNGAEWSPSNNIADYRLKGEPAGLKMVNPTLTPACTSGSVVLSGGACYIGLEVSSNAQEGSYNIELKGGNIHLNRVIESSFTTLQKGFVHAELVDNSGQVVTNLYSNSEARIKIIPPNNWLLHHYPDQVFTVSAPLGSGISFEGANSCTLTEGVADPCYVTVKTGNVTNELNGAHFIVQTVGYAVFNSSDNQIEFNLLKPLYTQITGTAYGRCALKSDNSIYCWGEGSDGQLGNGQWVGSQTPVKVDDSGVLASKTIADISGGSWYYNCVRDSEGLLYCWGRNLEGVLGFGQTDDRSTPVAVDMIPFQGKKVVKMDSGGTAACAIDQDGKVFCWGYNGLAQVGDGSYTNRYIPTAVDTSGMLAGKKLVDISGNSYHTCALDDAGKAYCWGSNYDGALGNNQTGGNYPLPVAVVQGNIIFKNIQSGISFNCGLTVDGDIYCWGNNSYGQLGAGDTSLRATAHLVTDNSDGTKYVQMSVGGYNVCALDTNNNLWCWGNNGRGQLGPDITDSYRITPVKVQINGLLQNKEISKVDIQRATASAAGNVNVCIITSNQGKVYCWGRNDSGDLGIGNSNADSNASPVMPLLPDNTEQISAY